MAIVGERCRHKTKARLRSILTYGPSTIPDYGIMRRLMFTKGRWNKYSLPFLYPSLNAYLSEERNFFLSSDLIPLVKAFCKSFGRINEYDLDIKQDSVTSPTGISIPLKSDTSRSYPHTDSLIPKDRTPKYGEGESVGFKLGTRAMH